jgi:protein-S-isoprenylcysteine O-methyltransferase Ste14
MVNGTPMTEATDRLERLVRAGAGLLVVAVLARSIVAMAATARRPRGRATGRPIVLGRTGLLAATAASASLVRLLWRALPGEQTVTAQWVGLCLGAPLVMGGAGLYDVARAALGPMHQATSALGVRLFADQRLVTDGPFGVVRHPMYLAVTLTTIGALLLYRTWATVVALILIPIVVVRAHREDDALEVEFGSTWRRYRDAVPRWIPRRRPQRWP